MFLDLMLTKAQVKRSILAWSTFLGRVYVFRLVAVQKTIKTEKNVKELSGSPGKHNFEHLMPFKRSIKLNRMVFLDLILSKAPVKRSFWAWSTFLEIIEIFWLDAVQKTIRTEKNVNELSDSPWKHSFEYYQHSQRHLMILDLMPSKILWKVERMWNNCRSRPGNAIC